MHNDLHKNKERMQHGESTVDFGDRWESTFSRSDLSSYKAFYVACTTMQGTCYTASSTGYLAQWLLFAVDSAAREAELTVPMLSVCFRADHLFTQTLLMPSSSTGLVSWLKCPHSPRFVTSQLLLPFVLLLFSFCYHAIVFLRAGSVYFYLSLSLSSAFSFSPWWPHISSYWGGRSFHCIETSIEQSS